MIDSVVAGCAVLRPWEAIVIGMVGGLTSCVGPICFDKMKIDDPVGALSVHMLCGMWVCISSIFCNNLLNYSLPNG